MADGLYLKFVDYLKSMGMTVETGVFKSRMVVEIFNDGPVTLLLDSKRKF